MAPCINFASLLDRFHRTSFSKAGLQSKTVDLGDGTVICSWVPRKPKPHKPNVVIIPGFGANVMWQLHVIIDKFVAMFNVYAPDLIFFGGSYTTSDDRTEKFQAMCLMRALRSWGVCRFHVVGLSYGGFVAYSMAAQFKEEVEKVVLMGTGVCWEEKDMEDIGMFGIKDLDEFASFLMPQTSKEFKKMVKATHYNPPRLPTFFINDFIDVMCKDNLQQRKELIIEMLKGRKMSDLPKIHQPTQIIWGEYDHMFPLEVAHRLVRYLDDKPQLVIIMKVGHAANAEKPKLIFKHIKAFLVDQVSQPKHETLDEGNKA